MKVIYLTWGETPRSYGVFGTQVVGQFIETAKKCTEGEFHFISAVPVLHSGYVREKWKYGQELQAVKNMFGKIKFHWLPIWASQNLVNPSKKTFNMMHGLAHRGLKKKIERIKPDIVHCRSYGAAWAAISVRKKYNLKYKVIFDGRGLWPEEVALKNAWDENSSDYKFLKSLEQKILFACDCSISVSDPMHEHYLSLGSLNDRTIYLSADTKKLRVDLNEVNKSETVRFCYVGALSESSWHQPQALLDLYKNLKLIFPLTKLTVVTTSSHEKLKFFFRELLINEVVFTSTRTSSELKKVFLEQDFGLLPYRDKCDYMEHLLGKTMLGTKTVEYLVAGLPVIVNKYCGGAASLVERNNFGFVYDPRKIGQDDPEKIRALYEQSSIRHLISKESQKIFDYEVHAGQYSSLYYELLKKNT